jgi:hypothetical protein
MKLRNNLIPYHNFLLTLGLSVKMTLLLIPVVVALPPPEDTPEEILRTEIITQGRSPIDNQPLTAAEYIELQEDLAKSKYPPELNSQLRHKLFLIQILKLFRTIVP